MGCGASARKGQPQPVVAATTPSQQPETAEDDEASSCGGPFHLRVEVLNKEAVIKAKFNHWWGVSAAAAYLISDDAFSSKVSEKLVEALPGKVKEAAGIDIKASGVASMSSGCVFTLAVSIKSYDFARLVGIALELHETDAKRFSSAYDQVGSALTQMAMPERYEQVTLRVNKQVRQRLMERLSSKLPERLADLGLQATVLAVEPTKDFDDDGDADPSSEQAVLLPTLSEPIQLSIKISDRKALLEDSSEGKTHLKRTALMVAGSMIPDDIFNRIVGKKLEKEVPEQIKVAAGIEATCERQVEEGSDRISLKVIIKSYDRHEVLCISRGQQFAQGFASLWQALETMASLDAIGRTSVAQTMQSITSTISAKVRATVQERVAEVLRERLHAEVEST